MNQTVESGRVNSVAKELARFQEVSFLSTVASGSMQKVSSVAVLVRMANHSINR
jgi:hypothetical protein